MSQAQVFQPASTPGAARPIATLLSPTALSERVQLIDILRGFALFGVLLVNMEFFVSPSYRVLDASPGWGATIDRLAIWAVRFLAEAKFYTLFSFLFGYGAAMQMARAAARQRPFASLYARRLLILGLIGAFHGPLLWAGDILLPYALIGVVLLLLRNLSTRTLLIIAGCCLPFSAVILAGLCILVEAIESTPAGATEMAAIFEQTALTIDASFRQSLDVYANGSVGDILARRVMDLQDAAWLILFITPNILAVFLLGLCAGRHHLLERVSNDSRRFRLGFVVCLFVGIIGNACHVVLADRMDFTRLSWVLVLDAAVIPISALALAAVYAMFIARQAGDFSSRGVKLAARWTPLAVLGRTALSNYLLQSVICTTLMCNYGLGLFGRIRPPVAIVLTAVIYLLQLQLSRWWLSRYLFGPAEWVWRSATYGRLQPMRR